MSKNARRNATALAALSGIALLFVGCAGSLPNVRPSDVAIARTRWPSIDLARLQEGRKTFVETCSGCHSLPLPRDKTPKQWPSVVRVMGDKIDLAVPKRLLIEQYLVTISGRSN